MLVEFSVLGLDESHSPSVCQPPDGGAENGSQEVAKSCGACGLTIKAASNDAYHNSPGPLLSRHTEVQCP